MVNWVAADWAAVEILNSATQTVTGTSGWRLQYCRAADGTVKRPRRRLRVMDPQPGWPTPSMEAQGRKPSTALDRCRRCVMTASTEGLTLDDNNVCTQCRVCQPFTRYGEQTVVTRFLSRRLAPTGHNCVVRISGGRDSSYGLFKVARLRFEAQPRTRYKSQDQRMAAGCIPIRSRES